MPRCLAALSLVLALAVLSGCKGDPKTPEYWDKKLTGAHRADSRVQVVETLRTSGNLQESFLPMLHAAARRGEEARGEGRPGACPRGLEEPHLPGAAAVRP